VLRTNISTLEGSLRNLKLGKFQRYFDDNEDCMKTGKSGSIYLSETEMICEVACDENAG
jgi:hypothetical protein